MKKAKSSRDSPAMKSFEGYWRRPDADAKALRDGWYFTGDTGIVDADGDLFVTGRVDDMIITGGENVSPVEIESCLSLHPAVFEVAVAGLPDESWGKIVTAFVKRGPARAADDSSSSADVRTCELQTSSPLHIRRGHSEISGRKAAASQARRRRLSSANARRPHTSFESRKEVRWLLHTFADPRLDKLDGFRVEIDPARERADIILDRPPFNIMSMPQRDQLRLVFETIDEDPRVRVIVLRAVGEHFSSGGNIKGFLEASPEHVSKLAWNIAAPARCTKPVIVANRGYCFGVGFEISLACDFRIASETASTRCPSRNSVRSRDPAARRACRRWSASPAPRTS